MPHLIDLTMLITDHFRWKVERRLVTARERGDQFQATWIGGSVHGFTHVDAPRHMSPDGTTTSAFNLDQLTGRAAVVDLTAVMPNTPISENQMALAGAHVAVGDIALLKTCWETRFAPTTHEFWTQAPWLTRGACEWLRTRGIKALGMDFPQDEPIRHLLSGVVKPMVDYVSHDVLLRHGVLLIEYLCNLQAITKPVVTLYALPLKLSECDGAPARVIAIE